MKYFELHCKLNWIQLLWNPALDSGQLPILPLVQLHKRNIKVVSLVILRMVRFKPNRYTRHENQNLQNNSSHPAPINTCPGKRMSELFVAWI